MTNELIFLSGRFFEYDLPKEKQFLFKYFTTDVEKQFIRYFYCFRQWEYFTDHTGLYCQQRWLKMLKHRHDQLVAVHAKAKREIDLEALAEIETGKYSVREIDKLGSKL